MPVCSCRWSLLLAVRRKRAVVGEFMSGERRTQGLKEEKVSRRCWLSHGLDLVKWWIDTIKAPMSPAIRLLFFWYV